MTLIEYVTLLKLKVSFNNCLNVHPLFHKTKNTAADSNSIAKRNGVSDVDSINHIELFMSLGPLICFLLGDMAQYFLRCLIIFNITHPHRYNS